MVSNDSSRSERTAEPSAEPSDLADIWEARARALIEGSGYDSELGVKAARDARRVVAGKLSAEEFGRNYHDAYLDEFGQDDRPESADGRVPSSGEQGEAAVNKILRDEPRIVSRREVLGGIGGTAAGVLFLGALYRRGVFGAPPSSPSGAAGGTLAAGTATAVRWGMVVDLERCDGCLACVSACREENGLADGALWAYVFAYREQDEERIRFLPRTCQHCSDAPCVLVCPTAARHRRSDGLVLTDYDVCIGCRYCEVACPYGVNYFQWGDPDTYGGSFQGERRDARGVAVDGDPPRGIMGKCNFCPERQDDPARRGTVACADACKMDALHFGDLNDPDSEPNLYLARRREENGGTLPTFRLLEDMGTEPNVTYIGSPPSSQAELEEWPVYESEGLVEDRRTVLEGPEPWFLRIGGRA